MQAPFLLPSLFGSVYYGIVILYLHLIPTYELVYTMLVFLSLGYLTQDDFFLVPPICLVFNS